MKPSRIACDPREFSVEYVNEQGRISVDASAEVIFWIRNCIQRGEWIELRTTRNGKRAEGLRFMDGDGV